MSVAAAPYVIVPMTGVRGLIASRMVSSLQTAPQLTLHADCDAEALLRARAASGASPKVGIEDLLIAAVARAVSRHPGVNGLVQDREIRLYSALRVGVAIALPTGLIVPALPDVRDAATAEIAAWRADLVARARTGRLTPAEMTRGTFTITNLGHRGVHYFTPILNTPQIAILGLGAIRRAAVVGRDGELACGSILPLSLTVDHRAIDGDPAADFLSDLRREIESPPEA